MPRVRRSKRKSCAPKCKTLGCQFHAPEDHPNCSYCQKHIKVQDPLQHARNSKRHKSKLETFVKNFTGSDELVNSFKDGTVIGFLKNLSKYEKTQVPYMLPSNRPFPMAKLMLRADQVVDLMENYQNCSAFDLIHQDESTISLQDKILGRVFDTWNLGRECFRGVIRCYWGSFGDLLNPIQLFEGKEEIRKRILKTLIYCSRDKKQEIPMVYNLTSQCILAKYRELNSL